MVRAAAVTCTVLVIAAAQAAHAQQTDAAADLVSSWILVAAERDIASGQARRVLRFHITGRGRIENEADEPRAVVDGGFQGGA